MSQTAPTLEKLNNDVQLLILQRIDSPRALLAYISASPTAARVFFSCKKTVLVSLISQNLSLQAVQTGIRIQYYVASRFMPCFDNASTLHVDEEFDDDWARHIPHFRRLGEIGSRVVDENYHKLSLEALVGLFRMCLFHEPFVTEALTQPWLAERLYARDVVDVPFHNWPGHEVSPFGFQADWGGPDDPMVDFKGHLSLLDGPFKGGVPLRARLYSGFLMLELFMRVGGINFWYDEHWERVEKSEMAQIFNMAGVHYARGCSFWAAEKPDLMTEMSLVGMYLREVQFTGERRRFDPRGGDRVKRLFGCCNSHRAFTTPLFAYTEDNPYGDLKDCQDDYVTHLINAIQCCWTDVMDSYIPTPYTWTD